MSVLTNQILQRDHLLHKRKSHTITTITLLRTVKKQKSPKKQNAFFRFSQNEI